jgi:hypothetical protein
MSRTSINPMPNFFGAKSQIVGATDYHPLSIPALTREAIKRLPRRWPST